MIVPNPNPRQCRDFHLQRLTHDELTEEQAILLAQHLDQCDQCRKQLDDTFHSDSNWETARETVHRRLRPASLHPSHETTKNSPSTIGLENVPWLTPIPAKDRVTSPPTAKNLHSSAQQSSYLAMLDGYPIVRVVGQGGMGVVLEAWDEELHRPVAIKAMHPHLASIGIARLRFIREARCAASIVHSNVIAIHRIYAEHHPPYFVMPLIAGESLQSRIDREGTIPIDQAIRIIAQVASGLSAAEEQGLVHRDVKPANILVEHGTDRALLTDFGLVRALHEATITMSGSIAGTPQYMSPEQARGESLDSKTDLYSLGAVLYTMLTGHPPFEAESPLVLVKSIAESSPKPVCYHEPSIPDAIQTFVEWLMERDKSHRPHSASQVAEVAMEIHAHCIDPLHHTVPSRIQSRQRIATLRTYGRYLLWSLLFGCLLPLGIWSVLKLSQELQNLPARQNTSQPSTEETKGTEIGGLARDALLVPQSMDIDEELRSLSERIDRLEKHSLEEFREAPHPSRPLPSQPN